MIAKSKKICTACLAAAVLLALQCSSAAANPLNPATAQDGQITAPNQWKIAPADAPAPHGLP